MELNTSQQPLSADPATDVRKARLLRGGILDVVETV